MVQKWDVNRILINIERRVGNASTLLQDAVKKNEEVLHSTEAFFASSHRVEDKEFKEFIGYILLHHTDVQVIEWVPRIKKSEREIFEEQLKANGYQGFQITERESDEKIIRAKQREEYFPVYYIEPTEKNKALLGFDLASNPAYLKIMQKVRDTAKANSSGRITLEQKKERFGYLVFHPIYQKDIPLNTLKNRREALKGFVVGLFDIGKMVKESMAGLDLEGIDIHIYDESAAKKDRFLYQMLKAGDRFHPIDELEIEARLGPHNIETIDVSGRKWQFLYHTTKEYLNAQKTLLLDFLQAGL
jgi:CHASE1-domain containing sensor protein